jgi:pentatricopeptide repeat protein
MPSKSSCRISNILIIYFCSLQGEIGYRQSLLPCRGVGSLASEPLDEDDHHGWRANKAGSYRDPHLNHFNHELQRDLPSVGPSTGVDRNRGVNVAGSANAHYGGNSEQPCGNVGSYSFQNSHRPYANARVNNDTPGYNVRQPYGSSSAYNQQSLSADYLNARQQYSGKEVNNGHSGYGKGQTYHHPNKYDTYSSGYNTQSNHKIYNREEATPGEYRSGTSIQSFPNSIGSDRQVYKQQKYDAHRSGGNYPGRPGNPTFPYTTPTAFHKEHISGLQQGNNSHFGYNASQAYQSPYANSKDCTHSNHQGYSMNLNTGVQNQPHGIYQEKHSHSQHAASFENHLNSAPHQDGTYNQSPPGNPSNDGSPYEVPNEVGHKCEGTVELQKLCEDGKVKEALDVLNVLQANGTVVNFPQYFRLMQACGDATALAEARVIHSKISESTLSIDTDAQNKILEMYARCGSMEDAKKLFSTMDSRNLTSWNTMISGFVHNGLGEEATKFFDQFKQTGDKPDSCMFKHIFLACGILSSVDEGILHFESMQKDFGITPTMEHYASIVNMLGQSGYIAEALEFVEQLPVDPSIDVWESLMNMCRLNGSLELGDRCSQIIERLDSSRLNEQSKMGLFPVNVSDLAKEKERKKASAAEARNKVHEYRAGDRSHPETPKIYEELKYLSAHMKEAGYIADTRFVLHDVDQETKADALLAHSERLAVSYGLITSAVRAPIRVIKNLRSCGDCHTALKIISKLVGRQIIARDAKRFHHFENGVCSCNDYW